jgi:two-component system chemotaxis response regulator CheY
MNVLVVDDYKTMIRIVRGLLEQLDFRNIDEAMDGPTALQRLQEKEYGLILSDWNMAPMTGIDLLRTVRAEPRTKAIPFIMVTAEAKTENVVAAKQAGANNYIIKPFTLDMLKQKLTAVLGQL